MDCIYVIVLFRKERFQKDKATIPKVRMLPRNYWTPSKIAGQFFDTYVY